MRRAEVGDCADADDAADVEAAGVDDAAGDAVAAAREAGRKYITVASEVLGDMHGEQAA
jgi:hypothetical protein